MASPGGASPIRKVEVVANVASGSVGRDAPEFAAKIFAEFGITANICAPAREEIGDCLRAAVDAAPDLLVILAGDGTARAAAELCGPDGPMIAPLPGGTMNMLPHAIYGARAWPEALRLALEHGAPRQIGGGEVEGHRFLVAAILGPPALWAPAREAARVGQARRALRRARIALRRTFTGRLRYNIGDGPREKAESLTFMCPLTSRVLDDSDAALEALAMDMRGAADLLKLGFHALLGDWRAAPGVEAERCKVARVWSAQGIPALLDGESVRLKPMAEVRYIPALANILAIPKDL